MIKVTAEAQITALNYALNVLGDKLTKVSFELLDLNDMLNSGKIDEQEFFEKGLSIATNKRNLQVALSKVLRVLDELSTEAKGA